MNKYLATLIWVLGIGAAAVFYLVKTNDRLPGPFKDAYMSGCDDGKNKEYCVCTINHLDRNLSNSQIYQQSADISENKPMSKEFLRAVESCSYLYNE